jgi:arylsulfatase A-like enzyme
MACVLFYQSVLLARRLLESGVKLVIVYWHRNKPGVVTTWDTHKENFKGLKDRLVPQVDQPMAHLLNDLEERGMLEDTLVVWNSEFGRTPKVNKNAGRDHWGRCNTIWMTGAGVPGGQMYGKSDKIASEPVEDAVSPSDVTATIYHLLGLDPHSHFHDSLGRPFSLSEGQVLKKFLWA